MLDKELLKYFFETDYKEYIKMRYSSHIDINLTRYVESEVAFLLHCLSDKSTLALQSSIMGRAYDYFPELNEWLPDVRL